MQLTQDQRELAKQYLWIAEKTARRFAVFCRDDADADDILGASYFGLCKAAQKFDPARGHAFATCAFFACRNQIREELRARRKTCREVAFTFAPWEEPACPLERAELLEWISRLPGQEAVVMQRLLDGYSLQEIGDLLKVSNVRVHEIKRSAINRLNFRYATAS